MLLGIKPLDAMDGDDEHIVGKKFPSYRAVVGFETSDGMEVEDFKTKWIEAIE